MPQDGMPKRDMPHDCMPNYWTAQKRSGRFVFYALNGHSMIECDRC